jgi:hypothetical protein
MSYKIDISINALKHTNISEIEAEVFSIASQYNCQDVYTFSENDGMLKNSKCKYIITSTFSQNSLTDLLCFIKNMKKNKNIHIECIYSDNIVTKVIYASQCYLKMLHKNNINNYKNFKKNKIYSEEEQMILQEL